MDGNLCWKNLVYHAKRKNVSFLKYSEHDNDVDDEHDDDDDCDGDADNDDARGVLPYISY